MRRIIQVFIVALLGITFGIGLGDSLDHAVAGGITGLLAGVSLGLAITTGQRRWLAMSTLIIALGGAFFFGGWAGVSLAFGMTIVTMFMMAAVTRDLYGGNEWEALNSHLRILIGQIRGFQIIAEGKTIVPANTEDELLGPRLVIIRPYNAVILEQGPAQTNTSGPDTIRTRPFEYVADIFDLGPDQRQLSIEGVLTADGAEVNVFYEATIGIDISEEKRTGTQKLESSDQETLAKLRSRYTAWQEHAVATIESCLRASVHEQDLHRLLAWAGYEGTATKMMTETNKILQPDKLKLYSLVIQKIVPKPDVRDTLATVWQDAERNAMEVKRAGVLSDVVALLASAYANAKQQGMTDDRVAREVLRHTMQAIIRDYPETLEMRTETQGLVYDLMHWLR